jgi:segregation and condensation protein A
MMMGETATPVPPVLAVVAGQPLTEMPTDLFIPPDALEVLLDSFSGPLDLLLYLIRQQNIDILDIPMSLITKQYMQYIDLLEQRRMELAADYLVMAALLAEIKSRLLLPASPQQEEIEEDPRMELVRRLQAYELFKQAAMLLDTLPRYERDVFQVSVYTDNDQVQKVFPDVELSSVVAAMRDLMQRQQHMTHHQISRELLSVRERMTLVLEHLQHEKLIEFTQLLNQQEGRMGLVVTLLAILELAKQSLVIITQADAYSLIHIQANQA